MLAKVLRIRERPTKVFGAANCAKCGTEFQMRKFNQKFCSSRCRAKNNADNNSWQKSSMPNLSTGTVGAVHELEVCADLLRKGYEVFRSVSQACSCDLAVLKGSKLFRVEVRTAYQNPSTGFIYSNGHERRSRADVLALVCKSGIHYKPPLEETIDVNA